MDFPRVRNPGARKAVVERQLSQNEHAISDKAEEQLPTLRRIKLRLGSPPHRLGISCARGPHGCHCITDVSKTPGQPQVRIGDVILAIDSSVILSIDEAARSDAINSCISNQRATASYVWAVVAKQEDLAQSSCSPLLLLQRLQLIVQSGLAAAPHEKTFASEAWAVGDAAFPGIKTGPKRKLQSSADACTNEVNVTGCWNIKDRKLQYIFYQAPGSACFCGYMKHEHSDAPLLNCYGFLHGNSIKYDLRETNSEKRKLRAAADICDGSLTNGVSRNEKKEVVNRFSASQDDVVSDAVVAMRSKHKNIAHSEKVGTDNFHIEIGRDVALKVVPLPPAGITLVQSASNSVGEAHAQIRPGDEIILINGREPKTMLARERTSELQREVVNLTIRR